VLLAESEMLALPERLDNDRYGTRSLTTARDVLAAHHAK
jgi:hypothetical protein